METVNEQICNRTRTPSLDREQVLGTGRKYWALRRAQDVALSLTGLALLWPLMVILSLVILLDSPGAGPIFAQTRVGRDGKEFTLYKFRTMCPGAEAQLDALLDRNEMRGPAFKIRNDPRVTRLGHLLRRSGLDELPQLWNVLRGEMSLVGPRPGLPREAAQYDGYQRQRLLITPGMTCYWQIQPRRNQLSFEEWLEWDLKYIRERSFAVDWMILLKTVGAVLKMNGA